MATIKDVAKEAGVSVATVSHVINQTRYVSPELTQKVKKAMSKLNYEPVSKSQKQQKQISKNIGIIVPDIVNPFYSTLIKEIENIVREKDFGLIVCNSENSSVREEYYIKTLIEKEVDGLIIAPLGKNTKQLKEIKKKNIPMVFINNHINNLETDVIHLDNVQATYKATHHLIDLGHERIALLTGKENLSSSEDQLKGYKKALQEHNINFDSELVLGINGEKVQINKLFLLENEPTAIVCGNNRLTLAALDSILKRGLECPEDISLVGFGDFEWSSLLNPPLTTVMQKPKEIGLKAAELINKRINGELNGFKKISIPADLKVRRSTQAVARGPFGEKAAKPDVLELTESEINRVKKGEYTAAISFHYSGTAWARLHEQGIRDVFNKLGIKILAVTDAHFNPELQIKQHQSLIGMDPDILISIPTDDVATAESYQEIARSKTKLVLITNVPKGLKRNDYVTCVSVNERENGQIAGRLLGEYLESQGKTKVGLIKHGISFFATEQRDRAAKQVLKEEFSNIEIISEEEFRDKEKGYEKGYFIMSVHPEIEGLYVCWDKPAMGVVKALRDLKREDVAITTADLDIEVALNMAKGGVVKGLSAQRPYEQGQAMALAAANAMLDKEVPSFIAISPYRVTPHNVLEAWREINKQKPPVKLIEAVKRNPELSVEKQLN